jgi:Flp pilus assembly pilin Flp
MKTFRMYAVGQDVADYELMLAVILLILAATVSTIGNNAKTIFSAVAGKLTSS